MIFPETIYGMEAMLARQAARKAGTLNRRIGGERWTREASRAGREEHPVQCKCPDCWRPMTDADRERSKRRFEAMGCEMPAWGKSSVRVIRIPDAKVPRKPRKKWEQRGGSGN